MPPHKRTVPAPGGTYPLGHDEVARIGYGALQLRNLEADPAKTEALLRRALELGVDHIDTAQFYGNGFANKMIRKVVPEGSGLVVASKVGADPDPSAKIPVKLAQRPEQLRGERGRQSPQLRRGAASFGKTCAGLTFAPEFTPRAIRSLTSMTRWQRWSRYATKERSRASG